MENTTSGLPQSTMMGEHVTIAQSDDTIEILSMAKKMHWVTSVVIGTIFVAIGLTGNTLSMLIWSRKSMRSSTGTYLIAQAIADSGLLIFFYLVDVIAMINPDIKQNYTYAVFFSYIGYPIFFFFVVTSIWLTVGVTVDRYIHVCWLTKAKSMCNHKKALIGIGIICFLCFIINLPHFNSYHADENPKNGSNVLALTSFGQGEGGMRYEFYVHCIFLVLAPWFTIFILNMLIIHKITKVNRRMSEKRGSIGKINAQKSENQITRVLLTVTFTFLFLLAFQCITQCFFMLKPANSNHEIVDEAFSIAKLGVVINSSINFFLYCLSGQRFRQELSNLIIARCRCCKNQQWSTNFSSTSSFTNSGDSSKTASNMSESSKL